MSAAERDLVDALVHDPDGAIDAADDGTLAALDVRDAACAAVVAAVVALVNVGRAPLPERLVDALKADGWPHADAVAAVLVPGAFEARGCVVLSVAEALCALAVDRERERLERRLVTLANALHFPGGIARVAAALGEEVAA